MCSPSNSSPLSSPLQSVWFDCDSTLSTIEGIDELAAEAAPEVREKIAALTDAAMDGSRPVESVYSERLALLRPNRSALERIGACYAATIVPDVGEVIAALARLGKTVGIISGGLRPAVLQFATILGIAHQNVHAVDIEFDSEGNYAGFETASPLARNGGKPEILSELPTEQHPLAFVGDGVTDLEAKPVVARFIGFGGVSRRARVVADADHFVDGPGLGGVLQFCLTDDEKKQLSSIPRFVHLIAGTTTP